MQPISNMLMMILVIGILTYGAIRVMQGSLTMGALISFLMYLFQLMGPVIMVSQFFNELAKISGSTERIREMLKNLLKNLLMIKKLMFLVKNCDCKMSASHMKKISKFCMTLTW